MKLSLKDMILAGLFAALMVVGAFLRIPLPFIEVTFQLFFAVFAGLLLKPIPALASQVVYILLGLIGIPVFSRGGGFEYVTYPTFGFIIGFAITAFVISILVSRIKNLGFLNLVAITTIGVMISYVTGILYFYMIVSLVGGADMTLFHVFSLMSIYLVKDFLLGLLAAYVALRVIPRVRKTLVYAN